MILIPRAIATKEATMKKIDNGITLNDKILSGAEKLSDAVGSTLGPRGRNVIIKNNKTKPMITKDGVTVSRNFELEDEFENLGAQIIKQAAESTVQTAGDGTTTSTVLAFSILSNAQKYLKKGISPVEIKRGIDKAVDSIVKKLEEMSSPIRSVEEIEQVATISANGDRGIGKLIATAVDKVGKDGAITVQEGRTLETSLDIAEGFQFDSGFIANAFITDERRASMRYDECLILVSDKPITTVDEIFPILQFVARDGRAFIIVCEDIEPQPLAALIMNKAKGTMKVTAIKAPRYGEERRNILDDLAIATGARFISRESGIRFDQVKLEDLGTAKTVESSKFWTTIVGGGGSQERVDERIERIKHEIQLESNLSVAERSQERITRLASGVAIINVGGATEIEMIEKKHRIEDALEAVKSAQEEGIVPGGGFALIAASNLSIKTDNEEQDCGVKIIKDAVQEPLIKMIKNSGKKVNGDSLADNISKGLGYNIATGKFVNLIEDGIIDPVKVTRCALQNAASAAGTLLTTSFAIVEAEN